MNSQKLHYKYLTRKEVGTYNEIGEHTWIDIDNTKIKARIGAVYAPQESKTPKSEMKKFYDEIQKKVQQAKEQEKNITLTGDLNAKIGEHIKGNNQQITKGGRLLLKLANSEGLTIENAKSCCKGRWTRIENGAKSVIDYILVAERTENYVENMQIDEEKEYTPYNLEKSGERVHTDQLRNVHKDQLALEKRRKGENNNICNKTKPGEIQKVHLRP